MSIKRHISLVAVAAVVPVAAFAQTPTPTATPISLIQNYIDTVVPQVRQTAIATFAAVETPIADAKAYAITASELANNYDLKCKTKTRRIPCFTCFDLAAIALRSRIGKNGGIFEEALKVLRADEKASCGGLR